jgi:hypothetical protein
MAAELVALLAGHTNVGGHMSINACFDPNLTPSSIPRAVQHGCTPDGRVEGEVVTLATTIDNLLRRSRVGHAARATQLGCSSSVRAWSIWSYAYVAMAAVVMVSPLWASDL